MLGRRNRIEWECSSPDGWMPSKEIKMLQIVHITQHGQMLKHRLNVCDAPVQTLNRCSRFDGCSRFGISKCSRLFACMDVFSSDGLML